jgi:hypothetical protein
VGFEFYGENFYIGGHNTKKTLKNKILLQGNTKPALAIDDLKSVTT